MKKYIDIIEENHTDYCACYQLIKWKVIDIAGYNKSNGFIVQKFTRVSEPENLVIKDVTYYEAWLVQEGRCIETMNQKYDDQFAVAHPMCQLNAFNASLNKKGRYEFSGDVFWIDKEHDSVLYNMVWMWSTNEVEQAGGLRSVYETEILKNKNPRFRRIPFIHIWSLCTDEEVYSAARKSLFKMCPNPNNKRDQVIFREMLDNMFGGKYIDLQVKLWHEWKNIIS